MVSNGRLLIVRLGLSSPVSFVDNPKSTCLFETASSALEVEYILNRPDRDQIPDGKVMEVVPIKVVMLSIWSTPELDRQYPG
jgi:hypothetical protein